MVVLRAIAYKGKVKYVAVMVGEDYKHAQELLQADALTKGLTITETVELGEASV